MFLFTLKFSFTQDHIFRIHPCTLWGFPCSSAGKESACNVGDLASIPGSGRSPGEGNGNPLQFWPGESSGLYSPWVTKSQTRLSDFHVYSMWWLPWWLSGKESSCSAGPMGSIPGSERSPAERNGYPLQYSCLENSRDRGTWWATVHAVVKSWTQLSN